jgi:aconitate hydratase
MLVPPLSPELAGKIELVKGPNIASLPLFEPLPDTFEIPVLLKVGDDISTDEIMPAGSRVLPYRSNIPKISEFCFEALDSSYHERAGKEGDHAIVGGQNYGQGSSREHAALAPRYLGLRVVIAKSFARIHWQNLINFGIVPLTFAEAGQYDQITQGDVLKLTDLHTQLTAGQEIKAANATQNQPLNLRHNLSKRQIRLLLAGGLINWIKKRPSRQSGQKNTRP